MPTFASSRTMLCLYTTPKPALTDGSLNAFLRFRVTFCESESRDEEEEGAEGV